jgi:hypothetical protein
LWPPSTFLCRRRSPSLLPVTAAHAHSPAFPVSDSFNKTAPFTTTSGFSKSAAFLASKPFAASRHFPGTVEFLHTVPFSGADGLKGRDPVPQSGSPTGLIVGVVIGVLAVEREQESANKHEPEKASTK